MNIAKARKLRLAKRSVTSFPSHISHTGDGRWGEWGGPWLVVRGTLWLLLDCRSRLLGRVSFGRAEGSMGRDRPIARGGYHLRRRLAD